MTGMTLCIHLSGELKKVLRLFIKRDGLFEFG